MVTLLWIKKLFGPLEKCRLISSV